MVNKLSDCICASGTLTKSEKWERIVGTTATGNLPQYKKNEHVGHMWHPCPYDSATDDNYTRALLKLSGTDPLPTKNDHTHSVTGKKHYMDQDHSGGWGFVCTFDECNYYIANGVRYFRR